MTEMPTPARCPRPVLIAGLIWIVVGSMTVLFTALMLLLALVFAPGDELAAVMDAAALATLFGALVGGAFLFVGVQTLRGAARDTLGNGIGSIVLGSLSFISGIVRIATGNIPRGLISMCWACALVTAGILALAGRAEYGRWITAKRARA